MKKATIIYLSVICFFTVILVATVLQRSDNCGIPIPEPKPLIEDDQFRIDLNTATADDFLIIPGVGPALAENIIAHREENGPFTDYSQLLDVKGIGHENIKVILEYIIIK